MLQLFLYFILLSTSCFGKSWTLEDMFKVALPSNVSVSPDDSHVLYLIKKAMKKENKSDWISMLYVYDSSSDETKLFSHKNILHAKWSPDGKSIGFIAKDSEKSSLWLLPLSGGESQLLYEGKNLLNFSFSPDCKKIALLVKDEKESGGPYIVGESENNTHLWLLDLSDKKLTRLTTGDFTIGTGISGEEFDWSPDSQEIAFPRMPKPGSDHWPETQIYIVNIATQAIQKLETNSFAMMPKYSPDGKWIAYVTAKLPLKWQGSFDIALFERGNEHFKNLALTDNRDFSTLGSLLGWSQDSKVVYAMEAEQTKNQVYGIPIDGSPCKKIDLYPNNLKNRFLGIGPGFVHEVSLNTHNVFGYVFEESAVPPEVFIKGQDCKQITHINKDLPLLGLGCTEVIHYKSFDQLEIEALLTYPIHYQKDKKYPLLLVIHGGPTSLFQEKFIGRPAPYPVGTFSSEGYAVLRCNIRGSNGYGEDFRFKNFRDWGGGDYKDLMTGVDHMIKLGIADPDRLGVMGWSYGGYMTSWIITQTNRFKAASVGAGVVNLVSLTGTTDIPHYIPGHFGGSFWEDATLYLDRSAIHHIACVETPTLIQHGSNDETVPLAQSYELYNALKMRNIPVKFVIYPRSGHAIQEPQLLLNVAQTNLQWFQKYLLKH